jgi:hypothetical protein
MIGTSLDVFFYKVYVDQQYIKEVRNSLKVSKRGVEHLFFSQT